MATMQCSIIHCSAAFTRVEAGIEEKFTEAAHEFRQLFAQVMEVNAG